jgi:hypothetical protein
MRRFCLKLLPGSLGTIRWDGLDGSVTDMSMALPSLVIQVYERCTCRNRVRSRSLPLVRLPIFYTVTIPMVDEELFPGTSDTARTLKSQLFMFGVSSSQAC